MRKKAHKLSPRFERALVYASRKHAGQVRKGNRAPYISHPLGVAGLVLEAGGDEDQAIAALLHDVVEDCGGPALLKEIRRRFGARVAHMVHGCTDPAMVPHAPWREQKQKYIEHLRAADADTFLVASADKLHNARSVLLDYRELGEPIWERFGGKREGALWYYRALVEEFRLRPPSLLVRELERVVGELESLAARAKG
ncbi:MAG: HD domain-containing protein [Acidobacteria bacterium]|jgi:GTP pyrophosphokinase|nr:HD domain-containing protein [Acidobacteriota bacterium]